MSHASFALIPNFATPAAEPPVCIERVPFHADPILAAIERHEEAYAVFQVAADGEPSQSAEDALDAARIAMLGTPCATRAGAFCLLRHLRWFLDEEASNAEAYGDDWRVAQAREADLTLLLGCDGVRRIPVALPLGRLASAPVEPVPPAPLVIECEAVRSPALVRLGRAVSTGGDALAAMILVVGGCGFVGFASLL